MAPGNGVLRSSAAVRRCLYGVCVAVVAVTTSACGMFSSSDGGTSSDADAVAPDVEALCAFATALHVIDGFTFEEVLTTTDDDVRAPLLVLGMFVDVREEDVQAMGPYEAGALAIGRRFDLMMESTGGRPETSDDTGVPDARPTPAELTSVRAADRTIASGACDRAPS